MSPGTVDVTRPGAAVASIVDVSDQMDQQRLLLESEQRFRLTLANAPIGIALVAPDGQFLQVNAELERLLGRTGEELAGLSFHDVTHPDDLAADVALVEALLRDEIPKYQLEKRYLHRDGSSVWGRLTVTLIRATDGAPCYFVSQIEDISEVRTAHAQLERRALYDPLTGLANRTLLFDRLGQAVRQHQDDEQIVAVAYCDLDHFKRSTTRWGTPLATSCSARSRTGCPTRCDPATPWPASEATSSSSCSTRCARWKRPPRCSRWSRAPSSGRPTSADRS